MLHIVLVVDELLIPGFRNISTCLKVTNRAIQGQIQILRDNTICFLVSQVIKLHLQLQPLTSDPLASKENIWAGANVETKTINFSSPRLM